MSTEIRELSSSNLSDFACLSHYFDFAFVLLHFYKLFCTFTFANIICFWLLHLPPNWMMILGFVVLEEKDRCHLDTVLFFAFLQQLICCWMNHPNASFQCFTVECAAPLSNQITFFIDKIRCWQRPYAVSCRGIHLRII